ncbi:alpha/beta hydrolase [Nodosilinea sp. E11]|uniref:alpha/beta hydrolase n=1 Tax=Nodosilinea sp. E11 TaxID=3037479 RepID=UPI0029342E4C|nr:alpha/beta hydrolase [Nodosilinea sp. E11]WOD40873.1 alpha/beta hydrolase [Nodosilinea sp. E11]
MRRGRFKRLLLGEFSWRRLVSSTVVIYGFLALYVFWRADSMIFLPPPASYQDTADILKVPVTSTEQISAIYLPNPDATYVVLYSHGNAEDLGDIRPVLDRLHHWGFGVFAYDYRGYGTSDGSPSEANAYQDVMAAYTYLTQQLELSPEQIIGYGRSVGGGPATELATHYPVAGLVLESSFTSVFRVVLPFPLLPFDKFPNLAKLPEVQAPVLVMHGGSDSIIPIHHGQALYEAAAAPKLSLWVAEAGHNDFTWVAGDRQRQTLRSFEQLIEAHQLENR